MFLLSGTPETMGLIALNLALARVPLRWGRVAVVGLVFTVVVYLIRSLPIPFGIHTIVGALLIVLFINYATKVTMSKALLISFMSLVALAAIEMLVMEPYFAITGLSFETATSSFAHRVTLGLLQGGLLSLGAVLTQKFLKPEQGAWKI